MNSMELMEQFHEFFSDFFRTSMEEQLFHGIHGHSMEAEPTGLFEFEYVSCVGFPRLQIHYLFK